MDHHHVVARRPGAQHAAVVDVGLERDRRRGRSAVPLPRRAPGAGSSPRRRTAPARHARRGRRRGGVRGVTRGPCGGFGGFGVMRPTRNVRRSSRSTSQATRYQRRSPYTRRCGSTVRLVRAPVVHAGEAQPLRLPAGRASSVRTDGSTSEGPGRGASPRSRSASRRTERGVTPSRSARPAPDHSRRARSSESGRRGRAEVSSMGPSLPALADSLSPQGRRAGYSAAAAVTRTARSLSLV